MTLPPTHFTRSEGENQTMNEISGGRQPHQVDRHVGALIRAKRKAAGMSQNELAEALGITFQQVQKYERGANRVSASKLYEIAQKLNTPLTAFFQGLDTPQDGPAGADDLMSFLDERGSHELMAAFKDLKPTLRSRLIALAKAMAGADAED
jgi:transcriptional regulator with XRE-family HTH domain